jgi:hypothetical protein
VKLLGQWDLDHTLRTDEGDLTEVTELPSLQPGQLSRRILSCIKWQSGSYPGVHKGGMDKVKAQPQRAGLSIYIVEV